MSQFDKVPEAGVEAPKKKLTIDDLQKQFGGKKSPTEKPSAEEVAQKKEAAKVEDEAKIAGIKADIEKKFNPEEPVATGEAAEVETSKRKETGDVKAEELEPGDVYDGGQGRQFKITKVKIQPGPGFNSIVMDIENLRTGEKGLVNSGPEVVYNVIRKEK